jgi:hypothetical protein
MEIVVMIKSMEILGMFWPRRVRGADSVLGDSGNDDLFHGDSIKVLADTQTDDSKDDIQCGSGIDTTHINVIVYGSTAENDREIVKAG